MILMKKIALRNTLRPYNCQSCGARKTHTSAVHDGKIDSRFALRCNLNKHVSFVHKEEIPYDCQEFNTDFIGNILGDIFHIS